MASPSGQVKSLLRTALRRVDDVVLARAEKVTRARDTSATPRAYAEPGAADGPRSSRESRETIVEPLPLERASVPRWLWLVVYAVAIVVPLLAAGLAGLPGRSFTYELGSALGIVALSFLALQLALPARLGLFAPLGADVALRLHRRLADVLVALIVAHVGVVIVADPERIRLLEFVGAPWRAQLAVGSVVLLGALYGTSMLRRRINLGYAGWRGLHTALAAGALLLAVGHTMGVGRYLAHGIGPAVLAVLAATGVWGVLHVRLWRPARGSRRPYVLEHVRDESDGVTTIQLRAHGHHGAPFRPGQFAWLKLGDERYGFGEHPFSYASSADRPDLPAFTIKSYEGFSADAELLTPGVQILVDGPHGAFRFDHRTRGLLLVAGGIGITPCMSILRTAADRADRRRFLLLYGSRGEGQIVFEDELEKLRETLDLDVVHVLANASSDWAGETGSIDVALLNRVLPSDLRKWRSFVCGPPRMVEGVVTGLGEIGFPLDRVHAEQFVEV